MVDVKVMVETDFTSASPAERAGEAALRRELGLAVQVHAAYLQARADELVKAGESLLANWLQQVAAQFKQCAPLFPSERHAEAAAHVARALVQELGVDCVWCSEWGNRWQLASQREFNRETGRWRCACPAPVEEGIEVLQQTMERVDAAMEQVDTAIEAAQQAVEWTVEWKAPSCACHGVPAFQEGDARYCSVTRLRCKLR
jgi:hypothetical protein